MTKIGLLVECGRDGLEAVVCRKICELLAAEYKMQIELDIVPMDDKRKLLEGCGTVVANLLTQGNERVIILWDERPAWPKFGEPLCWHNDRMQILAELDRASVPSAEVHLVCIEREFESWLLFDNKMLAEVVSTDEHKKNVPKQKKPDKHKNPKGAMTTLIRKLSGKTYVDVEYARRFAKYLTELSRLRKCDTFRRFEERVVGTQ